MPDNLPQNKEPGAGASGMSWSLKISEDNFVTLIIRGVNSPTGHRAMLAALVALKEWQPGMNILVDDRQLDYSSTSLDDIKEMSRTRAEMDALIGNGKGAVLVDSTEALARVRQYELLTQEKRSSQVKVFRDNAEAVRWLLE